MSEELNTSTPEDVKQEGEKFEVNAEEFAKLQELEKNKSIALKKEREEAQTMKQRLAELEAKEQEALEKERKKKGQYEELLSEKEELIKTLSEKAKAYDELLETKQNEIKTKLEELTAKVPDEVLEENKFILEDLSDEKKVIFLTRLTENKQETFDNTPEAWSKLTIQSEYDKAKKEGNIAKMLELKKQL